MSAIGYPDLAERLRRRFQIAGQDIVIPELAGQLVPVLVMEADPPEWLVLSGTRLVGGSMSIGGVAGEQSLNQLFNPAGSGIIAVITNVAYRIGAADASPAIWKRHDTALTTAVADFAFRDTRLGITAPVCQMRTGSSVPAVGTPFGRAFTNGAAHGTASTYFFYDEPIVLTPGRGVLLETSGANQTLTSSFFWKERPAAPWELQISV